MLFLRTAAFSARALAALRRGPAGLTASRATATYVQGQSPTPRIREYFYYIDHQGQLFLDDTKVKNFVTCFKGTACKISPLYAGRLQLTDFCFLTPPKSCALS
uniref:Uncharacterized protein n=1 Tax=Astatotilapia calliptera TaxID=8154 RepID=A0AAX7UI48_ASTCA